MMLIADGFLVFKYPGIGLFISLAGGLIAPVCWFAVRKTA